MQLEIEVGGMTHLVDLPPEIDTMRPVIIKLVLHKEGHVEDTFETQRIVYIRNGEIKVS